MLILSMIGLETVNNPYIHAENLELKAIVRFEKGNVYLRTQEYGKAIQNYTEAIQLKPNYAAAYHKRGSAYYFLRQYKEACEDWKQACKIDVSCIGLNFGRYQKVCNEN